MPMASLREEIVDCPYCGEFIVLLVDESAGEQTYVEDCSVCCQPIEVCAVETGDGAWRIEVRGQDE